MSGMISFFMISTTLDPMTPDRKTVSIDLPTSISVPISHRIRLDQFLRKRGNNVILYLVSWKCQLGSRHVSLMSVSDAITNWIRRGYQWFLAYVNSTSNLPTRITIPIRQRMTLSKFLRKRANNIIFYLVCTKSGKIAQLSAPTKYHPLTT